MSQQILHFERATDAPTSQEYPVHSWLSNNCTEPKNPKRKPMRSQSLTQVTKVKNVLPTSPVLRQERDFVCMYPKCAKRYSSNHALQAHNRMKHYDNDGSNSDQLWGRISRNLFVFNFKSDGSTDKSENISPKKRRNSKGNKSKLQKNTVRGLNGLDLESNLRQQQQQQQQQQLQRLQRLLHAQLPVHAQPHHSQQQRKQRNRSNSLPMRTFSLPGGSLDEPNTNNTVEKDFDINKVYLSTQNKQKQESFLDSNLNISTSSGTYNNCFATASSSTSYLYSHEECTNTSDNPGIFLKNDSRIINRRNSLSSFPPTQQMSQNLNPKILEDNNDYLFESAIITPNDDDIRELANNLGIGLNETDNSASFCAKFSVQLPVQEQDHSALLKHDYSQTNQSSYQHMQNTEWVGSRPHAQENVNFIDFLQPNQKGFVDTLSFGNNLSNGLPLFTNASKIKQESK